MRSENENRSRVAPIPILAGPGPCPGAAGRAPGALLPGGDACQDLRAGRSSQPGAGAPPRARVPTRHAFATALALASLAAPAPGRAAHPLENDDTGTLGAGRAQVELTTEAGQDRNRSVGTAALGHRGAAEATVTLGLRHDADLVVTLPTLWRHEGPAAGAPAAWVDGLGDIAIALKWRVLELAALSLAVKPGLTLPSGDVSHGLGTGRVCAGATLITSLQLDRLAFHLEAGLDHLEFARPADRRASRADLWHASLAAAAEVRPGLQLVANLGLAANEEAAQRTPPAFALCGVIWAMAQDVEMDLGLKVGLSEPETDLALLAGLTARF
jgi:hypothetical protein